MKSGSRPTLVAVIVIVLVVVATAGAFLLRSGDGKSAAPKPPPPATATKSVKEGDLNVVALTPEAEKRLDVRVVPVEREKVARTRFFGGQVVVPPGREVVVSAPFAGTVSAAPDGKVLAAGAPVGQGQAVFTLLPLLNSEARTTLMTTLVDAEGEVKSAEVQLDAAKVALDRAKQLVADNAAPKRTLDDAQAQYDLARKALEAAGSRRESLAGAIRGGEAGAVAALNVPSPEAGVLRTVRAAPGQMVAAGAPLFEVVNADRVWVRVPVYAGDVSAVAADRPAMVGLLGSGGRPATTGPATGATTAPATTPAGAAPEALWTARPVAAPPSADTLGSTVDLFFELDNKEAALSPGQKVGVTLGLRDEEQSLVVPWSAVIFDFNGGAWVYENVGPHAFARRRVQVRHVADGQAVLASGPAQGTPILTQGAAELFGYEMGFAK